MNPDAVGIRAIASELAVRHREAAWLCVMLVSGGIAWSLVSFGPFLTAAVIGGLVILPAIVRFPWTGVLLLVASVPAQDFGALLLGGQSLTLTRAVFPLALGGYVLSILINRDRLRISRLVIPFALLVLVTLISVTWAQSMSAAGAEAGRWITALLAFVILLHFLIDAPVKRITAFIVAMALAGVFQATYGVTQSIFAIGPESFRIGDQGSRAFGTFGQPNSYAGYLEMVFFPVLFLGLWFSSRIPLLSARYRVARRSGFHSSQTQRINLAWSVFLALLLIGSSVVILGGILASYSRGAWLGVAAGGVASALLLHRWIRRGALLMLPVAVLVGLGGAQSMLPASIGERISTGFEDVRPFDASTVPITDENFAAAERMAHWQAGWRMFDDRPLTGVGAGNFNEEYKDYFVREEFQFSRGHAHNYYIHLLAETGLPGMAAYAMLIGSVTFLLLHVILKASGGLERMLALGAFGTIVSVGVHNVFENLHVLNLSVQLTAVWALAIAAHRRWSDSDRQSGLESDI